jgi:hypothetical protein
LRLIRNANLIDKRAIVGSIFPEKLTFDGTSFRTAKMNSFAKSIFLIKKELGGKKRGDQNLKNLNPRLVNLTGRYPNSFFADIENVLILMH